MTKQEINVAIAEWRGLKPADGYPLVFGDLTNFYNDLNACHEAWDNLDQQQKIEFHKHLKSIVLRDLTVLTFEPISDELLECYAANATPPQRSTALVKTLNLWKE